MFYAARLALRDKENRDIRTVVVYFGQIEKAPEELRRGCLSYQLTNVYMHSFDGDEQYERLKEKVEKDGSLEDEDLLRLSFLPLMKSGLGEAQMTMRAAELAEALPGETGAFVQGVLLALSDRVLSKEDKKKLLEGLKMSEIARWLREEGREEGRKEAWKESREQMAKAALARGSSVEFVVDITGLSQEIVLILKREVDQERLAAEGVPVISR